MNIHKLMLVLLFAIGYSALAHTQEPVSEEAECLSLIFIANIFNDEIAKNPSKDGWSAPTPGEAITPFEPGDYLPKLRRIQSAANRGNLHALALLGDLYLSGMCVSKDPDLGLTLMDRAGNYQGIFFSILQTGAIQGKKEDSKFEAYMWLKIAVLRYPYISKNDAHTTMIDRGDKNPSDEDIGYFISNKQPPKEDLEDQLKKLIQHGRFTPDEIAKADNMAAKWIEEHPLNKPLQFH